MTAPTATPTIAGRSRLTHAARRLGVTVATVLTVGALSLGTAHASTPTPTTPGPAPALTSSTAPSHAPTGHPDVRPHPIPNRDVDLLGRVTVCGPHSIPVGVHYWGDHGDKGLARLGRDGFYRAWLHAVPSRGGELLFGYVDCAGPWPSRAVHPVGFRPVRVEQGWPGRPVFRDIR